MIVVVDATCLERNLNLVFQILEISKKVVVCVNLLDEAKKKGINVDLNKLQKLLGVPVVGTIARRKKTLKNLMQTVLDVCSNKFICKPRIINYSSKIEEAVSSIQSFLPNNIHANHRWVSLKFLEGNTKLLELLEDKYNFKIKDIKFKIDDIKSNLPSNIKDMIVENIMKESEQICKDVVKFSNTKYREFDRKIDKIVTSKLYGIPLMLALLAMIFWITITLANYPSELLSNFFGFIERKLLLIFNNLNSPDWLTEICVLGIYRTLSWVVSVMLPPMAIFFPLFTILEDLGLLPRIAFNLDTFFKKACTTGKQALTMCMGFGCNAARCYRL